MIKQLTIYRLAFAAIISVLINSYAFSQSIEFLNSNNVNAAITIGGNQFSSVDSFSKHGLFETPKGSAVDAIFTQALWLTGLDANDSLHCAANRYFEYGTDFFDGPVAATYDSIYDRYYKRVWKVTQAQITQFKTLSFPVSESQVDSAILFWPGKGNPSVAADYGVNIGSKLAPFMDLNNNGIYEPLLGEYPGICGDQGIFFVYNDARAAHTETGGRPLGVEIRGLATSFTDSTSGFSFAKTAINNAVFVQYEIENKSDTSYRAFDFGQWIDPDLGCFSNDRVGCDTNRNMMFTYNGTDPDPDCAPENGYGALPIALGVRLLNTQISTFGYFTGQGAASPAQSDPITPYQYRDFSEGLWGNDNPFTEGGNGFNGVTPTKFVFPGDPNNSNEWSELSANLVPGDRRMYMSSDGINLNAGATMHFDYVFFTSFDTLSNMNSIVDTLKRDGDIIYSFYEDHVLPCQWQFATALKGISPDVQFSVSVFPNPAHNYINLEATGEIQVIELMDVEGRLLMTKNIGAMYISLPVASLAKGVYLLNIKGEGNWMVKKIVIE